MNAFRDLSGLTQIATVAVWTFLAFSTLSGLGTLYLYSASPNLDEPTLAIVELTAVPALLSLLACVAIVGRWIYRAAANAHAISDEMTISPGWAVGWYFVPFANLVMPFRGMKEIWMASHHRHGCHGEPAPALLGWWWALWLVTNILSNISFQLSGRLDGAELASPVVLLDTIVVVLTFPLCLALVTLMQRIARAQLSTRHGEVFA